MAEKINFVGNMMLSKLTLPEVQAYFRENLHQNTAAISLRKSPFPDISAAEIAQQIKGMQIAQAKFPFLFANEKIIYPPSLNLEQASSYPTASYKSQFFQGKNLVDLTAGMGIDAYAFAQSFAQVTALERDQNLVEISSHNYQQLEQNNLTYFHTDFETFLKQHKNQRWDMIYLDPARRKNAQKKFLLEDLEPNILEWMDVFFQHADRILIKLSPLFDLKLALEKIPQIHAIHLVAVKNEMKELLLYCENSVPQFPKIFAANLATNQPIFEFNFAEEENAEIAYADIEKYLYEPNAALMKAGAFKRIAQVYSLKKLHPNTHLYTSNESLADFPGKVYAVKEVVKDLKKKLQNQAFHVVSKNHPLEVAAIRKKYKIKESEDFSLFFTQSIAGKIVLIAKKIDNKIS